jgi:hypothetical protein
LGICGLPLWRDFVVIFDGNWVVFCWWIRGETVVIGLGGYTALFSSRILGHG